MGQTAILWPMVAHFALVCVIYALVGWRRRQAMRNHVASPDLFKLNRREPDISASAVNNLSNQFELPVLFHAACLALFMTKGAAQPVVALAWLFVALRYAHAYVHVTGNDLRYRSPLFAAGFLVLVGMWGLLALHLLNAG